MKHLAQELSINLRVVEDVLTTHLLAEDPIVRIALQNLHQVHDDLMDMAATGTAHEPQNVVVLTKPAKTHTPWPGKGGSAA